MPTVHNEFIQMVKTIYSISLQIAHEISKLSSQVGLSSVTSFDKVSYQHLSLTCIFWNCLVQEVHYTRLAEGVMAG